MGPAPAWIMSVAAPALVGVMGLSAEGTPAEGTWARRGVLLAGADVGRAGAPVLGASWVPSTEVRCVG